MKKVINFEYGSEVELPGKLIREAPASGRFDDYAKYLRTVLDVRVTLEDSQKYLKHVGAWEDDELQDLDDNIDRLLWIAFLDCQERETTFWYMGE